MSKKTENMVKGNGIELHSKKLKSIVGKTLLLVSACTLGITSCSDSDGEGGGGSGSSTLKTKLNETVWLCLTDTIVYKDGKKDTFDIEKGGYASKNWSYSGYKLDQDAEDHVLTFWENGTYYKEKVVDNSGSGYYCDEINGTWEAISNDSLKLVEVHTSDYNGKKTSSEMESYYNIVESTDNLMKMKYVIAPGNYSQTGKGDWKKIMNSTSELLGTWSCEGKSVTLNSDFSYSSTGMETYWGENTKGLWTFTGKKIMSTTENYAENFDIYLHLDNGEVVLWYQYGETSENIVNIFFKKEK